MLGLDRGEPKDKEFYYVELAKLAIKISKIRQSNPTVKQLRGLATVLAGLDNRFGFRRRERRIDFVDASDHLFTVYPDSRAKLDSAFQFLKDGLQRNEAVMMITDEMTRDEILERMSSEWQVDARALEKRGYIIVKGVREWYFPDGKMETARIVANWKSVSDRVMSMGKPGLRVFGDASGFCRAGFGKELVEYEAALDVKFIHMPLTALCGYTDSDFDTFSVPQIELLQQHHKEFM